MPFLDKCVELGIKNIHVHKGPTIWPLDKDAFDVSDIDHVATDYNGELNFIVEHVGLPRIEDFCFMATQEPNVYAGLAVVIGGLMHARPKFFAKVMGELLFWVGEDKMLFGSDYAIWEPKWQVEGFVDWEMPDEDGVLATTRGWASRARRRSSASTPRSCTASRCRRSCRLPGAAEPAAADRAGRGGVTLRAQVLEALGHGLRPGARRADHHARLRRLLRRDRRRRRCGAPAAADAAVRAELRVPDGGRRARRRARGCPRCSDVTIVLEDHYTGAEINARRQRRGRLRGRVPGRDGAAISRRLRELFQRKALVARQ